MSSLKFGTSGLRGLVTDLVGWPSFVHARAFLLSLGADAGERAVLIGRDLRASSPGLAATVAAAAVSAGFEPIDCGALPTPALALEARRRRVSAVMVTGSHIPDDRNGLKFYRAGNEITKEDEAAILAALPAAEAGGDLPDASSTPAEPHGGALDRYRSRYLQAFGPGVLAGLTVAVYQQSSVARDLLVEVLTELGADVVALGRSEAFVPIDTEAHRPEDVAFIRAAAQAAAYDALVTTDGDADRPLMADGQGRILRGDVMGLIGARYLQADTVVVPVTAGSALERAGGFATVRRTRVGSPYVIAGMEAAARAGGRTIVGFEANGGFLLGSDVSLEGRLLPALPTRDALLPMLAVLAVAKGAGVPLADLVASTDAGETASDRLPNIPSDRSGAFLARLGEADYRTAFLRPVGTPTALDVTDGLRIALEGGRTIHFRASGNAPELRCYAEAATASEAEALVRWGLRSAAEAMS